MYDPATLTQIVEKHVLRNNSRKYYRFRVDRWYGGIVTGDVIGCNLRCKFCWSWRFSWNHNVKGEYLDPYQVFHRLVSIAKKSGVKQVRLSGGEPTIGFNHLIKLIELVINEGYHFVLETNGILLGLNKDYAMKLGRFAKSSIEIRVSIKGTSPEEFTMLTNAKPEYWYIQIRSLMNLIEAGLEPGDEVYAAVMLSFSDEKGLRRIKRILAAIDKSLEENIDKEYVILYKHVVELLKKTRLKPRIAFKPGNIPKEMI